MTTPEGSTYRRNRKLIRSSQSVIREEDETYPNVSHERDEQRNSDIDNENENNTTDDPQQDSAEHTTESPPPLRCSTTKPDQYSDT